MSDAESAAPTRPPWLDVRIDHPFPGCHVNLSCQFSAQCTVIFGPSGSGKSSLLRTVAGLLEPEEGHVRIFGKVVWEGRRNERAGRRTRLPAQDRRVGLVLQTPALFPHLTAAGNIGFALRRMTKEAARGKTTELLRLVDAEPLAAHWPRELSGGQQQRVAIARTLAAAPSVLLLDEPFGALDAQAREQLAGNVYGWAQACSVPVILVTHNLEEAFRAGDEVLVMDRGGISAQGAPQNVLAAERHRLLRAIHDDSRSVK